MAYLTSNQTFTGVNTFSGISNLSATNVSGIFTSSAAANFTSAVYIKNGAIITTLSPGAASAIITFPKTTGTLALTSDVDNCVDLSTDGQTITSIKNLASPAEIRCISGIGSINSTGDALFYTLNVNNAFKVNSSGTCTSTSFSGDHLGKLVGLTLPGSGTDGQVMQKSGSSLVWVTPGSVAITGMLLHDTFNADVYKLQITNGVLTTVLQ
ncbi:MAG: hypothetical protein JHC33_00485 [Ignisphaera sp.]|nr:hypothetical protein [Ignisphaera sp.]